MHQTKKKPVPIAQDGQREALGVSRIDSACAEEIRCHGSVLATGLLSDHAIGLGLQFAVGQLLNLELPSTGRVFAPLGYRRLGDPKGIGKRLLASEVGKCLICSHAIIL
jgi:hypothetical protein